MLRDGTCKLQRSRNRAIDISRTYAYTYIHSQAPEARHRYSVAYYKRQVSLMASEVLVFSAQSTGMLGAQDVVCALPLE